MEKKILKPTFCHICQKMTESRMGVVVLLSNPPQYTIICCGCGKRK